MSSENRKTQKVVGEGNGTKNGQLTAMPLSLNAVRESLAITRALGNAKAHSTTLSLRDLCSRQTLSSDQRQLVLSVQRDELTQDSRASGLPLSRRSWTLLHCDSALSPKALSTGPCHDLAQFARR